MERYGCEYPAQNPELRKKMRSGYIVYIAGVGTDRYLPQNERISGSEKLCFDSLPELAFFIWLNDNGYDFEYQPDVVFEYEYAGKKHVYLPDFLVDGMFVELKGDHFFDESGKMINPFRDPSWTDLEYSDECLKYEAKHQCMLDNGVTIMREEQYRKYIDYVNLKYGNDFLKKFKKAFSPVVGK